MCFLTHGSCRSVLIHIWTRRDFQVSLCCWFPIEIHNFQRVYSVWFILLIFVETWFIIQHMVCLGNHFNLNAKGGIFGVGMCSVGYIRPSWSVRFFYSPCHDWVFQLVLAVILRLCKTSSDALGFSVSSFILRSCC